jgi:flagellar biosynthesis/type III secretory pathway protein FliH
MSVEEMKKEVINKITSLNSESTLQKVLAVLDQANDTDQATVTLNKNYDAIKDQYGDVLQKLAQ